MSEKIEKRLENKESAEAQSFIISCKACGQLYSATKSESGHIPVNYPGNVEGRVSIPGLPEGRYDISSVNGNACADEANFRKVAKLTEEQEKKFFSSREERSAVLKELGTGV